MLWFAVTDDHILLLQGEVNLLAKYRASCNLHKLCNYFYVASA